MNLKYDKSICEKIPQMFENGESIIEVCVQLGINVDTFNDWTHKHKEFARAVERGKLLSQAWWEKLGRAGSMGQIKINPATWIFNMKNRFKWSDRQYIESQNELNARVEQVKFIDDIKE